MNWHTAAERADKGKQAYEGRKIWERWPGKSVERGGKEDGRGNWKYNWEDEAAKAGWWRGSSSRGSGVTAAIAKGGGRKGRKQPEL
jgi:hypothetical protein